MPRTSLLFIESVAVVAPPVLLIAVIAPDVAALNVIALPLTLPIWLFVSVTGVIVYLLLYQLYPPSA